MTLVILISVLLVVARGRCVPVVGSRLIPTIAGRLRSRRSGAVLNQRTGTPATASGPQLASARTFSDHKIVARLFRPFRRSSSTDNASFFPFFNEFCSQSGNVRQRGSEQFGIRRRLAERKLLALAESVPGVSLVSDEMIPACWPGLPSGAENLSLVPDEPSASR